MVLCCTYSSLEVRSIMSEALPKIIKLSKPSQERTIRSIINDCLDRETPDFIQASMINCILAMDEIDKTSAVSLLKTASMLPSWRVRFAICNNLDRIGQTFGASIFPMYLTKHYAGYLSDQTPETRVAALESLAVAFRYIEVESMNTHILPCLTSAANDSEVVVTYRLITR